MTQKKQETATVALFSREDLEALEFPREEFVVPGYGGKAVEIQALNAADTSRYQSRIFRFEADLEGNMKGVPTMEGHEVILVSFGMVNPKLTEEQVGKLPPDFVTKVANRIRELSKIDVTVEEAEGN